MVYQDSIMADTGQAVQTALGGRLPLHRGLGGCDFASSKVDQPLVRQLATLTFTDTAQNVVLIFALQVGNRVLRLEEPFCLSGTRCVGNRAECLFVEFLHISGVKVVPLLKSECRMV